MNGIINVYKEKGFTSFDVVAKLRGILKQKKIGHTGTLDPDAVGVLPVCLGNATKLCDMLTDKKKEYIAEFVLGITTDTQDISGQVLSQNAVTCTETQVKDAIVAFIGTYEQLPPMYSAIKVDGKRLYELARQGKEVERKTRPVTLYEIEVLKMELPNVVIRVLCSKGTYIRTLCHDIGQKLGCGATMISLERTMSGQFCKDTAYTLDEIVSIRDRDELNSILISVDSVFSELPAMIMKGELEKKILNEFNKPILLTSANKSGEDPALNSEQCYEIFNNEINYIIKGECLIKEASTIVDLTSDEIKIIREGKISIEDIRKEIE